jgi:ABC-type bacteriocin/lantibiotic exporter with double-glycine peptidase domain
VTALLAKNSNEGMPPLNEKLDTFKKNITFKNISFAYAKSQANYIENLNLKITQGKKIAIIGPTGSGKSTFLDLLLGMLEPDSGNIMMDDILLSKKNILSYRNNFAYVPQKIFFLEDTLKKNIAFSSDKELDEEKFKQAISSAFLNDLIDQLPEGLETKVSDSNQKVSGGQKQCIGIARAIYRGGDILILDEATSGMDESLEIKIYEGAFASDFQTFICVTHKSSLLNKFDEIIVFNNGLIEASGSYDELKKNNKFFNSMVDKQPY